jgi:arylsulfatase A
MLTEWVTICVVACGSNDPTAAPPPRPNIVLITADNLGYGDVGCFGNSVVKTPHLDRLAEQGVRCTDFYTASPTCTVSRASLLTGRYPQRHGLTRQLPGLTGNYGVGLSQTEILLPQLLRPAGYRTACFGKWNIGFARGSRPTERGFGEFFGHASGNIDYYSHVYNGRLDMHRQAEPVRVEGYCTDLFADAACRFIREKAQQPFFVYLPFNAPHFPNPKNKTPGQPCIWQAPDRAFAAYGYGPDTRDERQRYHAVITALDEGIGRVLATIDAAGLAGETLVIFFSDNGAFMLKNRGLEVASNKPLRDGGVTLWEGGIRVPCIVRWPGRVAPNTVCHEPLFSCDFFTMCIHAAGGRLPDERTIDGRDATAALAGKGVSPHEELCFEYQKYGAVRSGRFKLLRTAPQNPWMLFDLENDLSETTNVAADHPQVVTRLAARFRGWQADCAATDETRIEHGY